MLEMGVLSGEQGCAVGGLAVSKSSDFTLKTAGALEGISAEE